jgi:ABC-type sugar transport system permease subunit
MLPILIVWFTLTVYPNLEVIPLSFYKWNGISKDKPFVGFQNYETIISNPDFSRELLNTLLYILFLFVIQTVLALLFALILKNNTIHNKLFRTFFFLPLVFSSVMVGLTWSYMYDPNLGILNQLFSSVGLEVFNNFNWLGNSNRAVLCIVLVHIWANIGYPLTILIAGLQTIPASLYEAASVEGASASRTFFGITLPLLLPTLLRVTLLTLSTGAMAFDYVLLLGSARQTTAFDTWSVGIYKALLFPNQGLPAAKGVMLGIVMFFIFMMQYVVTKKVEDSIN